MIVLALFACTEEAKPPDAPVAASTAAVRAPAPPTGPRVAPTTERRVAASHILVNWSGAINALPNVTRTKEEARARAEEVRAKLVAGGDFAELAKAYSDDGSGSRGGRLGGFDDGLMVKPFEDATKALAIGQISELVETQFGFHVIRRDPLEEIHGAHLVITWAGAERAPAGVTRTKEEAKARVDEAVARLADGEPWATVVERYSDGPMKEDGGDLSWFGRSQLAPVLDKAAFDLDIGATSPAIETPRGFHILKRLE